MSAGLLVALVLVLPGCKAEQIQSKAAAFANLAQQSADLSKKVSDNLVASCAATLAGKTVADNPGLWDLQHQPALPECPNDLARALRRQLAVVGLYAATLARAAKGESPDYKLGDLAKGLKSLKVMDLGNADALDAIANAVINFGFNYERARALRRTVLANNSALQQVADTLEKTFASDRCTPSGDYGYCAIFLNELKAVQRSYCFRGGQIYGRFVGPRGKRVWISDLGNCALDEEAAADVLRDVDAPVAFSDAGAQTDRAIHAAQDASVANVAGAGSCALEAVRKRLGLTAAPRSAPVERQKGPDVHGAGEFLARLTLAERYRAAVNAIRDRVSAGHQYAIAICKIAALHQQAYDFITTPPSASTAIFDR